MTGLRPLLRLTLTAALVAGLGACAGAPTVPFSTGEAALQPVLATAAADARGRFREILCAVLEDHGRELPDYRPCEQALMRVGEEPPASGSPVELGVSRRGLIVGIVPGFGWDCFANWLDVPSQVSQHMSAYGYPTSVVKVDGLSGTMVNAGYINAFVERMAAQHGDSEIVLVGYSKGVPDILEFLVNYPEAAARVEAVISVAGAVRGSALAIGASQGQAELLLYAPGSECEKGDRGVVASMLPEVRGRWLDENTLPGDIPVYSVVTFPPPEKISSLLQRSYNELAKIDARNDSQLIYYDQFVPGSTLLAFVNADHWAIAVPIARGHPLIGRTLVNHNDFPREALLEALLRFVEEDLDEL